MEYARLGNTGLMVSELCLGCMTFGRETDEETSREIVGRFLDAGGNFIDTADVYSKGISEEITGRAIKDFASEPWGRNAKTSAPRAQQARMAIGGISGTRGSRNLPASEPCNPPELEPTNPTTLVPCVANQAAKPVC